MSKEHTYPDTLYVRLDDSGNPPRYQGRVNKNHLPIGEEKTRIAVYKRVKQLEVKREVVDYAEVG